MLTEIEDKKDSIEKVNKDLNDFNECGLVKIVEKPKRDKMYRGYNTKVSLENSFLSEDYKYRLLQSELLFYDNLK